jgi:hypothetical protein
VGRCFGWQPRAFWVGRIASAMPGPPCVMPAWAVKWQVDATVAEAQAAAMARNRNRFAPDARSTPEEALERHAIDEKHWTEKGYAPNHWRG